ncbi:MAG: hypothetical protein KAR00_02755 [Candidatus Pacebacteria bacterium]|nr:hypothetical protein [Candidatus Paceibacterota bacterium]
MGIPILKFREVDKERFEEIKNGVKAIETRAGTKEYQSIEAGGEIKFVCGNDVFSKKILRKYHWSTIEDMLTEVPIKKVMPNLNSAEQIRKRYASYPDYLEKIEEYGILGFELI